MDLNNNISESQARVLMVLENSAPLSYQELAEKTGTSYDGVRGRVSELINMGYDIERTKVDNKTKVQYLKSQRHKPLNRPPTYGDLISARHSSLDDFYGVTDVLNELRSQAKPQPKTFDINKEQGAILLLSDLHFGEIIHKDGEEIFNTAVAEQRLEKLTEETIKELNLRGLDHLTIAMLGDNIDGDMIYKNQMFHVEKSAREQMNDVCRALIKMFRQFVANGIKLKVPCVRGNHGISNYNNIEADNWDNAIYDMLSLALEGDPDISIEHHTGDEAKVDVYNRSIVLNHGKAIPKQIKTSSGLKSFRGLFSKHNLIEGDMILVGHLHQWGVELDHDKILIRNGAVPDTSDFAWKHHMYSTPCQILVIVDKDKVYPTVNPIMLN